MKGGKMKSKIVSYKRMIKLLGSGKYKGAKRMKDGIEIYCNNRILQ